MKKLILSITALAAFTFSGYSQCTPDPQFTLGGIYPDSAAGLPTAYVGYTYDEVITVVVPADTIVDIPFFGPTVAPFVDITLDNVSGLPPNFTYSCNPTNCVFPGNSSGCINLYSTANPTSADIGIYPLIIYVTATVDVLGVPTPQSQTIDYYFIEIKDSVVPTVSFNTSSVTVDESAGTVTVDVNIIDQNTSPTTVDVVLGTSTATNGLDFNYTTPTTATFPANSSTTQTVTLTIVDDAIVETSENIVLSLQNPTNGALLGINDSYTVTITDNDVNPVVSFNTSSITVNESIGTVTVDVNLIDPNINATTVDVALGTSTATDILDFIYIPTTVTFPAGVSTTQTVTLIIIDDAIVETSENIVLNLQNPTNDALVGTNDSYTVTITDNDVNPVVSFNTSSVTVDENAGTVTVDVNIIDQNTSPTNVDVVLGTSTATNGLDFNYTSPTTVTFPAGSSTTQTVTLTIIDDAIVELSENIVLDLQNPTNGALMGANGSYIVSITDNDVSANPIITFDASTLTVNENIGTVTVDVEILSENSNATSVDVTLGASTATNGDDFNYTSPTIVTFPASSSTTQTVTLTIIDDAIFEASENIVLNLQNPTNSATIGSNGIQTITIKDNDAAVVSFDASTLTVNENVGTVTVNVEILSENGNATSVDVALGASTATDGLDFIYTTPTTVTFPAGVSTTQTVTLTIIDDAIFEANENIVLNLQNPTNSATIGANGFQTITITDNDAAVVSFDASTLTVNENVGTVTVNVEILSENGNATSVDVALGASTATDGLDFNYTTPTTVTFPANSNTTQTVTLTIIDDAIVETSENIVLNLQNPTNSATVGSNGSYTVSITDNDVSANPVITFDLASATVNENVGTVTVNVEILSENGNATSVDVALGTSTATDILDFIYIPTTVTFPAGVSTTQTVTLIIIDDALVEGNENIVLNLQNPTNSATIGTNGTQTITITDNDAAVYPVVSFNTSSVTVDESAGTVTVDVNIVDQNANPTTVEVALGTSTATDILDFIYIPTTVTFPAGVSATQTVTLIIIDDALVEGNENIVLNLQNPTNGATLGTNGSYTITITDNEPNEVVENSLESIVMYPNPTASGSITLKGINEQNVLIEISNIIGQVVYSNTVSANGIVNLTEVSKGTYIVTLFNDSDRISKKLIIE